MEEGYNRNEYWRLCTRDMLPEERNQLILFRFDATWNIDRISWLEYWLTNAW